MSSSKNIENINTKLEAYKLIHDPTRLLSLLFSKYGDIEEDYYILYTNQIFYNLSSHFNSLYKENQYICNLDEFLKRFYKKNESIERVPKLSDYYKNYLKFFCRPFFKYLKLGKILNDFEDKKAEIFYKNNYADSANDLEEKEKENSDKKSSSSLSSLDNITNNKIIFDQRTKKMIDNNLNNEKCTLTLTLESSRSNLMNINGKNNLYNGGLISKRSNGNSSFEKNIYSLVHYKLNKKKENIDKKLESKKSPIQRKKKLLVSPSTRHPYIAKIFKKNYNANNYKDNSKKIKKSLYTLSRKKYKNNFFMPYKNEKGFLSPKVTKHNINFNNGINSKFEEFNKNRPINYNNFIQNSSKKNKTYNNTNNINSNKIIKPKNSNTKIMNSTSTNTIYKNFSILSETLNKYKKSFNKNSNVTYSNKNNSKILKYKKNINSTNILVKSNNNNENNNKKKKAQIDKMTNKQNIINTKTKKNSNFNNNKPQSCHNKNKTFDFNTINQNDQLSKYNTNNNFDNYKSLLNNNNNNNQKNIKRKKMNSKFNLIKKPINEVIELNPILSPQAKRVYNKITTNKSIPNNKEKKKKIFYGLSGMNGINNSNNYNIQHKFEINSPKSNISNKKNNNMTFNLDDNNKIENNNNLDGIIKKNKIKAKKNNLKKSKKKLESLRSNIVNKNWKIKTSCLSPLSNYSTNLNRLVKNINYSSFNNTIKMDNSASQNNNSAALKSTKKMKNSNINTNFEMKINNNNYYNTNKNGNSNDLFNVININQNTNSPFSRNKKHNSSKISNTQSHKEVIIKDIHIKSIKNLKANCIGNKSQINNMTCSNDSNLIKPNYNINYNYYSNKINSSTEVKNNHIKDVLFNLNKISIKKKNKKYSQRISKIKENNNFYIKPKKKYHNNRGMLSGDNIFNRKKIIEIKQNSLYINNKGMAKDNNNIRSNDTISHERGNSLQIINVNRNINLINKKEIKK